jgi:hypothetical protein
MMRRGRGAETVAVQLFPFLAVLMCTMGALVVLLVVLSRHVRDEARRGAVSPAEQQAERGAVETLRWRAEELRKARGRTHEQLADRRRDLSHVEDHLARLRGQLDELRVSAEALGDVQRGLVAERAAAELARLEQEIAVAQERVRQAEIEVASRRPSYAVVPYAGAQGTRRRPIYLECRAESVVLQPEGIEFTAEDFLGPLGPGNPLAAVTRAVSEHLAGQQRGATEPAEPYPFLLVRPDGVLAYSIAREALESWGSDFGYELVDADWKLEFPQPDAELTEKALRVAAEARELQRNLMLAAPRQYAGRGPATFRATARHGGVVRERGERSEGDDEGPRFGGRGSAAAGGSGAGPQGAGESGTGTEVAATVPAAPRQAGTALGTASPRGVPGGVAGGTAAQGTTQRPGGPASLAESRGQDWGLPDAKGAAVAVTRPVFLQCLPDRLVIEGEAGAGGGRTVSVAGATEEAVDELVSSLWKHMQGWGLAGKGMYWRPTLVVEVAPQAEGRYTELLALLSGSGLEMVRREQYNPSAALPARNSLR